MPIPLATPPAEQPRATLPVVCGVIAFPALGTVLAVVGMPSTEIYSLLSYCGAIGVGVTVAVSGGRRFVAALAQTLLRVGQ
ncbi:hypothetical protein [Streptomyces toxytricini]|uniref:hypothetical protein n=1 Tax=Streptomyces toxytricini TaxID=67369 RepID=UPI003449F9B4